MSIYKYFFPWLFLVAVLLLVSACGSASLAPNSSPGKLKVVAAENFYGDIARQLGGEHITVTSILADPQVDPHTYQSNVQTGLAVSQANLVIANGGGYDDWMDQILSGSPSSSRLLLKAFDIAPYHLPDNEHVWYSFADTVAIAQGITSDLTKLDPNNKADFEQNLQTFKQSIQSLEQKVATIKTKYGGTPVGLTETIYLYQTELEGLQVLTPFEFEKAIAEANDPPAATVITATDQITNHQIKVLIINAQTVTPVTTNLSNLAREKQIPVVQVTETMPQNKSYQTWMMDQLDALQTALGK